MSSSSVRKKLVIVGDGACGKTCLLMAYSQDRYSTEYIPTVLDNYTAEIQFQGKSILMSFWDTAGQEEYDRLRALSYPNTDVVIMCFSVAEPDTLTNISQRWIPEVQHCRPRVPIILVGNKTDLRNDSKTIQNLRAAKKEMVKYEDGKAKAVGMEAYAYLECSALTREGISEVFTAAIQASLNTVWREKKRRLCRLL